MEKKAAVLTKIQAVIYITTISTIKMNSNLMYGGKFWHNSEKRQFQFEI